MEDDGSESLVKSIVETEVDDFKKANLIYDFVRIKIKTTEHKSLAGEYLKEPSEVIKASPEVLLKKVCCFINMLRNAGLNAKPVWISTRKNGTITSDFCDGSQFNRFLICLLKIKTRNYFLYPVSLYSQFGCLTPNYEVSNGLLIDEEKGSIISITPEPVISSIIINTIASINSEKTLNAKTTTQYLGYAALDEFDALQDSDTSTYVKDYLKKYFTEAKLDSIL